MTLATPRPEPSAGDASPTLDLRTLDGTCLSGLPDEVAARLLRGARVELVEAGQPLFPANDGTQVGILLAGSSRTYIVAADGRQLAVRYSHAGSLISRQAELSGDHMPLRLQAVTDCRLLGLGRTTLLALATEDPKVAMALVSELSARLLDVYETVADTAFGSMRQRVVRHLLALAAANGRTEGRPTARVSQQQLADGIGTSREVVARVLGVLRNEGLIRTAPREIELLDDRRLASFLGEWRTEERHLEPDLTFEAERLLEASPNAVVAVDADGAIVFVNTSTEQAFGWPREALIGSLVEVLVPERKRPVHLDHRRGFLERPHARPMGLGLDLWGRRQDGSEFPIAVSLTTIDTREGVLAIATVVDLSEERAAIEDTGGAASTEEPRAPVADEGP